MPLVNFQQQGSGADILLIHGLLGSLENLNMVAKGLSDHYRVTSIDVRNHGNSFHEDNMSYHALSQDVINVLDHLNIEKTHILGHSMGGKIAMKTALSSPSRVNKLLVADIAPVQYPPHHQKILAGLKAIDVSCISNRKEADAVLKDYVELDSTRQFLLRNLHLKNGVFSFKCHLDFIASGYPLIMGELSAIKPFTGKTLFIKGGNSDYILPEHKEAITKLFSDSKAKIINNAGHWLHAEKTPAFNKITLDFLAS